MLGFICTPCAKAGEALVTNNVLFTQSLKKAMHEKCQGGTWCDCQHRIDRKNV